MPTKRIAGGTRRRCVAACENCKRRKERCDGNSPCRRCVSRRVQAQCQYSMLYGPRRTQLMASVTETSIDFPSTTRGLPLSPETPSQTEPCPPSLLDNVVSAATYLTATFPSVRQLILDGRGGSTFLGDAANESFLQQIRQLVAQTLGSCPLVDEPTQCHIVDDTSVTLVRWNDISAPLAKPDPAEASYLVNWCMRVTNHLLGVVSESGIQNEIAQWLEQHDETVSLSTATYYFILANGALSCPEEKDYMAEAYFSYARHLTSLKSMDEPNLESVLCYSWMAFYQLNIGRRNAAYHSVGIAVRAACALGIHRADLQCFMSKDEHAFRERLWKALRKLDFITSVPLGRPICTNETRDTKAEQGYSSTIDITTIMEAILKEVYSTSKISKSFVVSMTNQHRLWATRIADGLKADGVEPAELLDDCESQPNLAFYNIKEAYYWSIMLLTRPFLLERASTRTRPARSKKDQTGDQDELPKFSHTDTVLVYACVDSAVRTVDLLHSLLPRADLPKRLPFVVNSVFGAALTLAVAILADLDRVFPLQKSLHIAENLLRKFQNHDSIAKCFCIIVKQLQSTCGRYIERRDRRMMESQGQLVSNLFGRVHGDFPTSNERLEEMNVPWTDAQARAQQPLPQSPMGSLATMFSTGESLGSELLNASGSIIDLPVGSFQESQLNEMGYVDDRSHGNSLMFSNFDVDCFILP